MKLNPKTSSFIRTRDILLSKRFGYQTHDIENYVSSLFNTGQVEVGWRQSCGSTDSTVYIYRAWKQVLLKLRKEGHVISEETVTHPNRYASNNGGFWNSTIYSLI